MKHFKKVLAADQIRKADAHTILNEPIASIDLMERASMDFVAKIQGRLKLYERIAVVCGPGNNGGDGFAIARILKDKGFEVDTYFVALTEKLSDDCQMNMDRIEKLHQISSSIPSFEEYNVLIDAIFGSGLTRPITEGLAEQVIKAMNASQKTIFSVDIPSGLFCDKVLENGVAVQSHLTVSFQRPKLCFFFTESDDFIQEWTVADIGLDEEFIQDQESSYYILGDEVSSILKTRKRFSHKGKYGHALIMAGSYGMMGAAVLSSKACLKSGVGLLTSYVPKCGYDILQISIPEAMCLTDQHDSYLTELPNISKFDCIGIGPGLGRADDTRQVIRKLFEKTAPSLVIDADALNLISEDESLLDNLPKNSIITPHLIEFKRLVGDWSNSEERIEKQKEFSKKYECVVVLKGAHTSITGHDGNVYFNITGNPGMATAGSGDVLTGMITGLRAQGYSALHAAIIGVHFHGKAGDMAKIECGEMGMIASDLIRHLRIESNE